MGLKLKTSHDRRAAEGLFVFLKQTRLYENRSVFDFPGKINK
jgi:hypothetical protein